MATQRHFAAALLAAGLFAATGQATAATGSASISNVRFELIDLDLNDGITPALALLSYPGAGVQTMTGDIGGPTADMQWRLAAMGAAAGPLISQTGPSFATGTLFSGDVHGSGVGASTSAAVTGAGKPAYASVQLFAFSFQLTPQTQLRLLADASVASSGKAGDTAKGDAGISLQNTDILDYQGAKQLSWLDAQGGVHVDGSSALLVGLRNDSAQTVNGAAYAYAITSVATAVPEPMSAGLLLAGLAGLGALSRRRR